MGNKSELSEYYITELKWKHYTFIVQISNKILNQCISLWLYKIGHITKEIIGLKLSQLSCILQGDNSYSENGQFIRHSFDCKHQIFVLLSVLEKLMWKHNVKAIVETLKSQNLKLPPFVLNI